MFSALLSRRKMSRSVENIFDTFWLFWRGPRGPFPLAPFAVRWNSLMCNCCHLGMLFFSEPCSCNHVAWLHTEWLITAWTTTTCQCHYMTFQSFHNHFQPPLHKPSRNNMSKSIGVATLQPMIYWGCCRITFRGDCWSLCWRICRPSHNTSRGKHCCEISSDAVNIPYDNQQNLDKRLNSLNRDMFKPFRSHSGLLGWVLVVCLRICTGFERVSFREAHLWEHFGRTDKIALITRLKKLNVSGASLKNYVLYLCSRNVDKKTHPHASSTA